MQSKDFDFNNYEATLKSGQKVRLDFSNYTFREYIFGDKKITLDSKLVDEHGSHYNVYRIKFDSIELKDNEGNLYDFPKKSVNKMNVI